MKNHFIIINIFAIFLICIINANQLFDAQGSNSNSPEKSMLIKNIDTKEFNVAVAGDFGCSTRSEENIKNIKLQEPELFLALGDLSYEPTPDCWFSMTKNLDSKTKIAIGNHEDKEESSGSDELIKKYLDHYNLPNSYYSFNFENLHVLVLNTQLEFSVDIVASYTMPQKEPDKNSNSNDKDKEKKDPTEKTNLGKPDITLQELLEKYSLTIKVPKLDNLLDKKALVPHLEIDPNQFEFAVEDLKKAANDKLIDWIFVVFHKPIYSSPSKQIEEYIVREKYQPLFDHYNVDLVLQAHNHIYDRTLPLKFNYANITNPFVDRIDNNNAFDNPDGTIYSVVGTGGKGPARLAGYPLYVAAQDKPVAGFLNIDINGKSLKGTFYANEQQLPPYHYVQYQKNVIDEFTISKTDGSQNNNNNEFDKL